MAATDAPSSSRRGGDGELESLFFDDAADHVAAQVTARNLAFSDRSKQLAIYGLYKQATVGPCNTSKPGIFDPAGRAKWDAWNKLGALSSDDAKQQYVQLVQQLDPGWQPDGDGDGKKGAGGAKKGGMGPVFSAFAVTEEDAEDARRAASDRTIHELVGQGDCSSLAQLLTSGAPVDEVDEQGCTALHFAADRGNLEAIGLLLGAGADVNAADEDGQRPLHYAALCRHQEACKLLLSQGADASMPDASGSLARDVGPPDWTIWGT